MWLALIVAVVSLLGAYMPLRFRPAHAQLQLYLSLAAGALLGAALFHLLPEAAELIPGRFGLPMAIGIVLVFLLQRYVAPHSHELPEQPATDYPSAPEHAHGPEHGEHAHTAGPFLGGLIAILALSIHSFFDGVAVGVAVADSPSQTHALTLSVFLSVLIHKPMDGLSVSVLLLSANVRRQRLWLIQIAYAALVPLGAAAFMITRGLISEATESPFLGYTLAFSAGIFCSVALTDLLPELHFHRHDRHKLSGVLLLGLAIMWVASLMEAH